MDKIIQLYEGVAIYKAHVDELRERDVNAQVQTSEVFDRLKTNIQLDKRLESLPLCYIKKGDERNELGIISGHHRTRAARMANVTDIYVIAIEDELTEDEIIAKQLSHNALVGESNKDIVKKMYESIQSIDEKIKSGVYIEKTKEIYEQLKVDEVNFDFDFEILQIMFLPSQLTKFERVEKLIGKNEKSWIAKYEDFEKVKEAIQAIAKNCDIRNIAAIISRMCDITLEYYASGKKE